MCDSGNEITILGNTVFQWYYVQLFGVNDGTKEIGFNADFSGLPCHSAKCCKKSITFAVKRNIISNSTKYKLSGWIVFPVSFIHATLVRRSTATGKHPMQLTKEWENSSSVNLGW